MICFLGLLLLFSSQLLGCLVVFYPGSNQIQPCLAFGRLSRLTKCRHLLCFAFRILMSKRFRDCTICDIWIPVRISFIACHQCKGKRSPTSVQKLHPLLPFPLPGAYRISKSVFSQQNTWLLSSTFIPST